MKFCVYTPTGKFAEFGAQAINAVCGNLKVKFVLILVFSWQSPRKTVLVGKRETRFCVPKVAVHPVWSESVCLALAILQFSRLVAK